MDEEYVYDDPVKVKKGYMYYVGPKGYVWEGKPGDPSPDKKLAVDKIIKRKGYRYYVNTEGYICINKLTKSRK